MLSYAGTSQCVECCIAAIYYSCGAQWDRLRTLLIVHQGCAQQNERHQAHTRRATSHPFAHNPSAARAHLSVVFLVIDGFLCEAGRERVADLLDLAALTLEKSVQVRAHAELKFDALLPVPLRLLQLNP